MAEILTIEERLELLKKQGMNTSTVVRKKPVKIKKSLKVRSTNQKNVVSGQYHILESKMTLDPKKEEILEKTYEIKDSFTDSLQNFKKSIKKSIKESIKGSIKKLKESNKQTKKNELTFKDVIKKRIFGKDGETDDHDKLSVVKKVEHKYKLLLSNVIEDAVYLTEKTTSFKSIPISIDNTITELTPEMLDKLLLECDDIYELYGLLEDFCEIIAQLIKGNDKKPLKENKSIFKISDSIKIKREATKNKKTSTNIENAISIKLQDMENKTQEALKEFELKEQNEINKNNQQTKKKEQEFKKLFEDNSKDIEIKKKNGFIDTTGKYHQFRGFHYEIKSGNTTYIIDVDEKELSKMKPTDKGIIEFKDLEKCLSLSIANTTQIKSGINKHKIRKQITKFNTTDITDKFASAFEDENLDIELKKKAFLKAFGNYVFDKSKEKKINQKFNDFKQQETILDKKNKKIKDINYLYYVLVTKPKLIEK